MDDDFLMEDVPDYDDLLEEVQQLRQRIHEVVDGVQRRYAPYQSRCDRFDTWSKWAAKQLGPVSGEGSWAYTSEAHRLLVLRLIEQRDEARALPEKIARAIEVAQYSRCPECGGKRAGRRLKCGSGPVFVSRCGCGNTWEHGWASEASAPDVARSFIQNYEESEV